uniref:Sushi domain-containing protein n=1 Tax=Denticeps clupeoides TaxID=299321 RepID=A0AAY4BUL3_9TELE
MCDGMVACQTSAPVPRCASLRLATPLVLLLAVFSRGHASGCPRPSGVQHGWVNLTETNRGFFPVGTVLLYSCDSGYMVDGPAVISCTPSGRWSYEPPLCIRTNVCQPPNEPENGGYTCHPSPCHRLTEGTVIEYFCDEGYALKGEYKYRTCQNGEWDTTMQISCHFSQEKDEHSPLAMPALSIVASTASSVALILLLVVLFVLVQPKLKSFHHSRREQGVSGQPTSIMVEGMQVTLPSYEEAVYGSGGACAAPAQESRVQIVLSEGPQAEGGRPQTDYSLPSTSAAAAAASLSSSSSSSSSSRHSETVLVHQVPCCSSSSSSSSPSSWAAEQPGASASAFLPHNSESSDQHSLLSLTSTEDFADDIPLLKEA